MIAVYPEREQIERLLAGAPSRPVVMLNLLRFKERADAPDQGLSGEQAYQRYADEMVPLVERLGGRVIWSGRVDSQVIGVGAEEIGRASCRERGEMWGGEEE